MNRQDIIRYLSEPRMKPYLEETNGNLKNAIHLYEWHSRLSAEVKNIVGDAEIILRNAIDIELTKWNAECFKDPRASWLLQEPAAPLIYLVRAKREQALRQAKKNIVKKQEGNRSPSHHDVLSQITFGLWKEILPNHAVNASSKSQANADRLVLWDECLAMAFPHEKDTDGFKTFWRVSKLKDLRNRVAHMDSLLNIDVQDYMRDSLFPLMSSINPSVSAWLSGRSQVNAILKSRPQ